MKKGAKKKGPSMKEHIERNKEVENLQKNQEDEQRPIRSKRRKLAPREESDESEESDVGSLLENLTDDYSTENSDVDCVTAVHFNGRSLNKLRNNISCDKYYIISFGKDLCYVGKVVELKKKQIMVKFMQRLPDDQFTWKADAGSYEEVEKEQFFCGPLKLEGTFPFKIMGVESAHKAYLKYNKEMVQ